MKWAVDASVTAKWLAPEPESPLADALLDNELIVPDLLFAEMKGAPRRRAAAAPGAVDA